MRSRSLPDAGSPRCVRTAWPTRASISAAGTRRTDPTRPCAPLRLPVQQGRRKVIAILDPSVAHMAWGHSVAPVVIDAADQHGFGFGACDRVVVALLIELGLHRVKEFTLEDGGLLAGQDLAL